ncbi:hypothetical protein OSB04_006306 [Centaurea solstitialis]|uniref:CCHC-type domain-containing protein n=1 Tax=Centaurea solstitialis TaxID=347529 RepID=A0AA38TT79_9ASTR|nr:hypothetical protein OSB04_006306 [Centaurea solstitialis]
MSKEIIGIGSETRPPVLVMGEYQQWIRRMIHFLDLLDENLMKSIREGSIRPTITVAVVPRTETCPALPAYVVEKLVDMYSPEQIARHLVDKSALTLLIMALPNDILGVEKSKYEVNVKFLKNLTQECMMVQHEEFISGGRSKRPLDHLALAAVPFGGPNSAPIQPTSFNHMPLPQHPEDLNHEFNQNYNQGMQHPDDPMIITISDEELFNMNESLALISHNMQRLNANQGFTRSQGSGFQSGNIMGLGRGIHQSSGRYQFNEQGRGGYQHGERYQSFDQGRSNQGRFRDNHQRDSTYIDYQGGSNYQGNWRGQNPDYNFRGNSRHRDHDSGFNRQGYESGYGGRFEGGRNDQGYEFGYEQESSRFPEIFQNVKQSDPDLVFLVRWMTTVTQNSRSQPSLHNGKTQLSRLRGIIHRRIEHGKGNFNGGDHRGSDQQGNNSNMQSFSENHPVPANQGGQKSSQPQKSNNQTPAPQQSPLPKSDGHGPTCYKCGKPGHYSKECTVKYKDAACFEKKATLMRKKEKGVALLVEEENWVCEEESSDEEDQLVRGHCLMADFEGPDGVGPSTHYNNDAFEVSSIPDLTDTLSLYFLRKELNFSRKSKSSKTNNFKRGQSEQTLSILTMHANKNPFYKARPGLGHAENHVLEKAPSNLYNFEDMAASKPKPAFVGGHVTEEFVRQTITYTEVINGETITKTTSPSNSTSSSPPTSPAANGPIFIPARDPTNTDPSWEVIPPMDVSTTKSPDLVELEKEVFGLRLKAIDLDACQHQILNLRVIISEKDNLVDTLEKDLLEANAERIRLSSECETANSSFTVFKVKFADLQKRLIAQEVQFEIENDFFYEKEMMYRRTFVNQDVSISLLKKKVSNFENFCFVDYEDDEESLISHHKIREPKTVQYPNVEYELKVFLYEDDDPSGFIPKKKKSVLSKPEKSTESQASGSEKSNPKGEKCVGTDKENSVKPHAPKGLQNKNSKSNDAHASVKPIKGLDFNSSTFEVGETSRVKPNQPLPSTKPNFSKPSSGKGGKSIYTKPSSNSHHAFNADGRRKDGGKNVKPPGRDH